MHGKSVNVLSTCSWSSISYSPLLCGRDWPSRASWNGWPARCMCWACHCKPCRSKAQLSATDASSWASPPLQGLFARCCRPLCTPETLGAYRFGKRLMALDGTMQDVPDTQANAAEFSRPSNQYGEGPFPQIRLLVLNECGSHATVDATISDGTHAERRLAEELVPSLEPAMFLVHDAQFSGLRFWQAIRARRAHVMGPLPSHHLPTYLRQLSDGSYLAVYMPSTQQQREGIKPLLVRVIEYRITDARLGEPEQIYRLATTWLNPRTAPALDLIDCYHERWEVEVVLDEIKTHQRLQQPVLRSRTPEGVRKASLCAVTGPLCGACAHASRRLSGWRGPRSPQFYRCDLCPV